ncbi:MAG: hypothetical protein WD470_12680 [Rhodospirillaceae bacterium]
MLLKWVVLAAIVAAVWFGFKAIARRNRANEVAQNKQARERVADMTACSVCGTFVAEGETACGRGDCPYPA